MTTLLPSHHPTPHFATTLRLQQHTRQVSADREGLQSQCCCIGYLIAK